VFAIASSDICSALLPARFAVDGGDTYHLVRNGFERVSMLLRTGHVDRPDVFIAAPAAVVTASRDFRGLGLFPSSKQIMERPLPVPGGNGPGGWLLLGDIAAFAPQYLNMFKPIFGN